MAAASLSFESLGIGCKPAIVGHWVMQTRDRQYLDGMVANVLSNALNALFDLTQIKITLFQGNVTVDDYSKGNVVIPLFHYSTAKIFRYSIIPLQPPTMSAKVVI